MIMNVSMACMLMYCTVFPVPSPLKVSIYFILFPPRKLTKLNKDFLFRSQFLKMGKEDGEEKEPCCPLRLRTGNLSGTGTA